MQTATARFYCCSIVVSNDLSRCFWGNRWEALTRRNGNWLSIWAQRWSHSCWSLLGFGKRYYRSVEWWGCHWFAEWHCPRLCNHWYRYMQRKSLHEMDCCFVIVRFLTMKLWIHFSVGWWNRCNCKRIQTLGWLSGWFWFCSDWLCWIQRPRIAIWGHCPYWNRGLHWNCRRQNIDSEMDWGSSQPMAGCECAIQYYRYVNSCDLIVLLWWWARIDVAEYCLRVHLCFLLRYHKIGCCQ